MCKFVKLYACHELFLKQQLRSVNNNLTYLFIFITQVQIAISQVFKRTGSVALYILPSQKRITATVSDQYKSND
jgi:hypothetical protein